MEVGLSLGANTGDRLAQLREAAARIERLSGARVLARSPVYETDPVGVRPEHSDRLFLNAILVIEWDGSLERLADALRAIEAQMGRRREEDPCAPRPIDIDVIYADGMQRQGAELTLPHPRWAERRFVVQPLADVRPGLVLPGATRCVAEVLAALPETPRAQRFAPRL